MGFVKSILNKIPSKRIRSLIHPIYYSLYRYFIKIKDLNEKKIINDIKIKQISILKNVKSIKQKRKINVVFIVINSSIWKYDLLYSMFCNDDRYNPVIAICPQKYVEKKIKFSEINIAVKFFKKKGFRVFVAYNYQKKTNIDIKKELNPDIVFFTNPHHRITYKKYYIKYFIDKLTCYFPYGIMSVNKPKLQYDQLFHNLLWKAFYETDIHKEMTVKYARNKGVNTVVSGSLMYDVFVKNENCNDVWKIKDKEIKRIIYAPHHSFHDMEEMVFSTFLENGEFMLEYAKKNKDKVQIAFKPHPVLKNKLYKYWGIEKTDNYYKAWDNLFNGQLEEGDYMDLFLSSDAMIMDSISFMTEYFLTGKPSLFLMKDKFVENLFNDYGKAVLSKLYKSYNNNDILNFIHNVVINGEDNMKEERELFIKENLVPPNNNTAAENIYNYINKKIFD